MVPVVMFLRKRRQMGADVMLSLSLINVKDCARQESLCSSLRLNMTALLFASLRSTSLAGSLLTVLTKTNSYSKPEIYKSTTYERQSPLCYCCKCQRHMQLYWIFPKLLVWKAAMRCSERLVLLLVYALVQKSQLTVWDWDPDQHWFYPNHINYKYYRSNV